MDDRSAREASGEWKVSERQTQTLHKNGRIDGILRLGRSWMMPKGTEKPGDKRRRESSFRTQGRKEQYSPYITRN
jgi:hypothetical protein